MVQRARSARQQVLDAIDSTTQAAANKWDLSAYQNAPKQPERPAEAVAAHIANRERKLRLLSLTSALAQVNRTCLGGFFSPIERKDMGIQALRERKDELAKQANNMIANAGDKVWSKEEAAAYDQMTDEIGRINAQIKAITEQADLDAEK